MRKNRPMLRHRWLLLALAIWSFLLLAELGHYALWDDEALVALSAKGIERTGDTSVRLDHGNVVAYRNGNSMAGLADRSTPPLPAYLTAASFELFGASAGTARLPFALLGLGTGLLLFLWAEPLVPKQRWLFLGAVLGNVSLLLFSRQCRYYSAAIFFSLAIVFVYWRWKGIPRNLLLLAALSVGLFASNYLDYLALYAALGLDYLIWRRREKPLDWRGAFLLFAPQLVLNGAIFWVWNPFRTPFGNYELANTPWDRLMLFFWCWRDMDRCEFFALPLLLLALGVGWAQRRAWMVRGCMALVVYVAAFSAISPQLIRQSVESEVRFLAPVIPLVIALQVGALWAILQRKTSLLVLAALLAFGTNLFNGGPFLAWGLRSTALSYLGELSLPQDEPYTPTAAWINDHVPDNASVWVTPYYAVYPLMFAAPRALYAWQLSWPPRPDLTSLPPIQFAGREAPDYIVTFGPARGEVEQFMRTTSLPGFHYRPVATLNYFWKDMYRPELCWRNFESVTNFDAEREGISIYQRVK
jgi:hypothetical protein